MRSESASAEHGVAVDDSNPAAAELVLGPLLRYAGTESATFWVETSRACEVGILGQRSPTFTVEGHHYALVLVEDLAPGSVVAYEVRLDGKTVWPVDDERPAPVVRTRNDERQVRLVFGSCRVGDPHPATPEPSTPDSAPVSLGVDALWAYSLELQRDALEWPDALLLLGDQVYADEVSPATAEFIRGRRDLHEPPGEEIADFEEYTRLYHESWSDPDIRWLLATVPSVMIFDDHDVNDDWNISRSWVEEMRRRPWWDARITGAFMSYWIYQHLGNLSPPELAEEETLPLVQAETDGGELLRARARSWDRETAASRWAFYRDFGELRLLVLDSRAARVLADGQREMIDHEEWDWIVEHSLGRFDHLVIASTLPVFLPIGVHHLEAWNEAVCSGRWGDMAARVSERLRRAVDLEHWAAFNMSFERLCVWLRQLSEPERPIRHPPRSSSSAGMSTTSISRKSSSGNVRRAESSRLCARRSETPSQQRNDASSVSPLQKRPAVSSPCSRAWPECQDQWPIGTWSANRASTTRSGSSRSIEEPRKSILRRTADGGKHAEMLHHLHTTILAHDPGNTTPTE